MIGIWDVTCRGKKIGQCTVSREGLYYRFRCICNVKFDKVCCLQVRCGERTENLGVLVPVEDGFGLNTKVAAKRFGEDMPLFAAVRKSGDDGDQFIPVHPDEPFAYLSRIRDAYLSRRGEQIGVVIK